jgi:hypothetical protein
MQPITACSLKHLCSKFQIESYLLDKSVQVESLPEVTHGCWTAVVTHTAY